MAECTDAERAALDSLRGGKSAIDVLAELAIQSVPQTIVCELALARADVMRATARDRAAWENFWVRFPNYPTGNRPEFDALYKRIQALATAYIEGEKACSNEPTT
jgi:hypothetical protein